MSPIIKKNIVAGVLGPLGLFPGFLVASVFFFFFDLLEGRVVMDVFENRPLSRFERIYDITTSSLGLAAVGLIFAYPITWVFGLPAAALLRRLRLFNLPILLLVSLIPACIICSIFSASLSEWLLYSYASLTVAGTCWALFKWV